MEIVHIFGPADDSYEGLWSLKLDGETSDEFRKILEIWLDTENLQQLFKPLDNRQSNLTELQLSKGSAKSRHRATPKLRLYAVRIGENTFVVTGGAIKLTNRMEERPHTKRQLIRLTSVKDWLRDEGILFPEDLTNLS